MTGPSSVKSSTDDDDNEISLIFVLPMMDIELSRAVPRVNKNLKKKRKSTDVAVVQQLFNAFLLIHVRVFIFCLVSLFFFFFDSFILIDTFQQRPFIICNVQRVYQTWIA